jgi:hypothetical protein
LSITSVAATTPLTALAKKNDTVNLKRSALIAAALWTVSPSQRTQR